MRSQRTQSRRGTTTVELAITCPIAFFLIIATVIGGMGVFRYQQVAALSREGARWASVHGSEYALDTGKPAATGEDVFNTIILPAAVGLDPDHLTYEVSWNKTNDPLTVDANYEKPFGNTVSVRVNYEWFPELFLVGPFMLTSTSTAQMAY